jgi:hypothetical protein
VPRDVSALGGRESLTEQIPVSLVQLNIPGWMTGTDVWGTAPLVNHGGGYAIGASSIVVDGLGAGTIPSGAFFRIGTVYYSTTAPAVISGGGATLAITPALRQAVTDNQPLVTVLLSMCDVDVPLYLNPGTGAVSTSPGAGLVAFTPYAGLTVPQIQIGEKRTLSEVSFDVSNLNGDWGTIVAANAYRETAASIWQGNLALGVGASPDSLSFAGAIAWWSGRLEEVKPNKLTASLTLSHHLSAWTLTWPYRTYSAPGFRHLPVPGTIIKFGYTETQV